MHKDSDSVPVNYFCVPYMACFGTRDEEKGETPSPRTTGIKRRATETVSGQLRI